MAYELAVIDAFLADQELLETIASRGVPWRGLQESLKGKLPSSVYDLDAAAYALVPKAMDAVFGLQGDGWITEKRPSKSRSGFTTWIIAIGARD